MLPTNIFLDVLLSLVILVITLNVYKNKRESYLKITAIILIFIHILTIYIDYFGSGEYLKIAINTVRFVITMFLTFKISQKNKS